jgi:hypothetical protein
VINPVETLSNSIKSVALNIIRQTGIRTAKIVPVSDPKTFDPSEHGLSPPFFIREDQHHGGPMLRVESPDDLKRIPWERFARPAAVEWINVQGEDGYFRKYRYFMMNDSGVPRHLAIAKDWCVHAEDRVFSPIHQEEELRYTQLARDPRSGFITCCK